MALARPARAWYLAGLTTLTSVLGGFLGYLLGALFYELVAQPLIGFYGVQSEYRSVMDWFRTFGAWAVLVAGLTPIPYKVFTLAAGSLQISLLPFVMASLLGRGLRFFVLAGIVRVGGKGLYRQVERWKPALFWAGAAGLAVLVAYSYLGS